MMKAALLLALLPLAAGAQEAGGRRGPDQRGGPSISAGAGYSGAEGLRHRSLWVSDKASLGVAAGRLFTLETGLAYHVISHDGWLPPELYNAGLRLTAADKKNTFSAGIRSNSDRPFHSMSETDVSLGASRVLRRNGPHLLSFGLMYSSRRSFARHVPFPYLAYSYTSDRFSFVFPFSASWRPSGTVELAASYFPPDNFQVSAAKKVSAAVRLKAEFAVTTLQYELAGRADKAYSTFIKQSSAGVWTYVKAWKNCTFSLWTGYALKGKYYSGKDFDEYRDRTRIGSAPSVSLALERAF